MSVSKILAPLREFFALRKNRRLAYLLLLCLFALGDFLYTGLARRTFVFYTIRDAETVVEERFLRRSGDRETDIRRYAEQALLGPIAQDWALLFPREARVQSVMYRQGVVFVDLTEEAALPPPDGGTVFNSFLTLNRGIRRNFSFVNDVRMFVGGDQSFFEEFRDFFAESADNSRT